MINKELKQYLDEYIKEHYKPITVNEDSFVIKEEPISTRNYLIQKDKINFNTILNENKIDITESCCSNPEKEYLLDESFNTKLLRLIDEKGLKDSDVYNKASVDRRLFSKIRNENYHPSKETALALCITLKLPYDEIEDMLDRLGYSLSDCSYFDVIIKAFLKKNIYDLVEIDVALKEYDQKTIRHCN